MDRATRFGDWTPRVLSLLRIVTALLFMTHCTAKVLGFPFNPRYQHLDL